MAKKLRKLVLPIAMLFGAGAGIENVSKKNAPEKIKKPVAEFMVKDENKVHKSGADTWKSEGNIGVDPAMSDESELEPIIITVPRYHPEAGAKENLIRGDKEKFKVHKSAPDTLKSDEYKR